MQNCAVNPFTPNDHNSCRTAPLTSKRCILYIYLTNIGTEYFKHGIYSPFFPFQNAVCFIILTYLVPYYSHFIYRCAKIKNNSGPQKVISATGFLWELEGFGQQEAESRPPPS